MCHHEETYGGIDMYASLLHGTVYAGVGDVKSILYNIDIVTYLDGRQIQGYSLDCKIIICVEDLRNYGYT